MSGRKSSREEEEEEEEEELTHGSASLHSVFPSCRIQFIFYRISLSCYPYVVELSQSSQ
jgi:hypothetical protein